MGYIADQVLKRTAAKPLVRYGRIEAVSDGLASVRMGSTVVADATWCRGYAPIVGDRVAVLASGSGWLILDAVETVQRAYNEPETILVEPLGNALVVKRLFTDSWDDNLLTPEIDPRPPEPVDADWGTFQIWDSSWPEGGYLQCGIGYYPSGDGSVVNYVPAGGYFAPFVFYPRLDAQAPGAAIITSVSLIVRMRLNYPGLGIDVDDEFPVKVSAHSMPMADDESTPGQPPEFYFNDSFEPLDAGVIHPDGLITIPLPDEWVSALSDGTLTGVSLWPGETQKHGVFFDDAVPEWQSFGDPDVGYYVARPISRDNMHLRVSYITPVEEN